MPITSTNSRKNFSLPYHAGTVLTKTPHMTIPIKSLHPDFSIPAFGLGSWMMGGKLEKDNDGVADEKAVREAIDQGITHIDTAELYAAGFAEEIVGNAIAKYDRSKLMIVSKVSSANLHYKNVIESAEKSLLRLKTDYLDLYLVHAANPSIPMKETMDALTEIKRRGMIRNIGVSNFTKERMQEAQSYTKERIVANQVHYNLRYREPELTGLTQYCLENKIILVAWRPISERSASRRDSSTSKRACSKVFQDR